MFILSNSESCDTANITYALDSEHKSLLTTFNSHEFEKLFGPGLSTEDDAESGYVEDEWYWEGCDGAILGIGWRFGKARLRGKNWDVVDTYEFMEFLRSQINANM